jgi:hypothetical protein
LWFLVGGAYVQSPDGDPPEHLRFLFLLQVSRALAIDRSWIVKKEGESGGQEGFRAPCEQRKPTTVVLLMFGHRLPHSHRHFFLFNSPTVLPCPGILSIRISYL